MKDNMPNVILELLEAQRKFDSEAYSSCFTDTATVFDEGKNYSGRPQIKNWIEKANTEYKIEMDSLEYSKEESILKARISGQFPGSSVVLNYQFVFSKGLIQSLKIA